MAKQHPEQRDDEIFMGNVIEATYKEIAWRTKRRGMTPYHKDRTPMTGHTAEWYRPLFVKRSEVEQALQNETDKFRATCYRAMLLENDHPSLDPQTYEPHKGD